MPEVKYIRRCVDCMREFAPFEGAMKRCRDCEQERSKGWMPKKANLGVGPLPLYEQDSRYMNVHSEKDLEQWLLIDLYIQGPQIHNWDIEKLDKIPDGWLEEIFTSHVLEHISHRKVIDILKLWHRKLDTNGKITIIVPDLLYALKQLKILENEQAPDGYYTELFGLKSPLSIIYGTHSQPGEYHLGGFTEGLMTYALQEAGFHNIETSTQYEDHQMDCVIARATK